MQRSRSVIVALVILLLATAQVMAEPKWHDIRPGYGVTELRWLSDYLPDLKGSPGDTRVYVLQGERPGGQALVLGGTHGDEIAGIMAATWLVERMQVETGTLFVIPRANNSASTYSADNRPGFIELVTAKGTRSFAYGDRRTHPDDQVSDSKQYWHPDAAAPLSGDEARNLNRVHPGKADGTLTEQISYAIAELIKREGVDVAFDLHEAGPTSRLANMVISHPKSVNLAAEALFMMELEAGISLKLEVSAPDSKGLSHRAWGDHTEAAAFIVETPNPGQNRNKNNVDLVNDPDYPLAERVGVQLHSVQAIVKAYSWENPDAKVELGQIPSMEEWRSTPLGHFYNF